MGMIFSEYDIRGHLGDGMTVEYAWTVGKAFAEWIQDEGAIVVARINTADQTMAHGLIEGLLLQGRDVIDMGVASEQQMLDHLRDIRAKGAVVIAHDVAQDLEVVLLFNENGVAVTAANGLAEITALIEAGNFVPAAKKGEIKTV